MDALLERQGFVHLPGLLSQTDIERARGAIDARQNLIQYEPLLDFVDHVFLPATSQAMSSEGWDLRYVKLRVSNNNNSSDASTFHRDVICLGAWFPVLTCLSYLDETSMELIPGTHRMLSVPAWDLLRVFRQRVRIRMRPGDVLLFYSTILHRGIFTEKVPARRLIQVFDVFQNPQAFRTYSPWILHLPGNETYSDLFVRMSKHPLLIETLNLYGYANAAMGYGAATTHLSAIEKCRLSRGARVRALSSEGLQERLTVIPGRWQPLNKYILPHADVMAHSASPECVAIIRYAFYNRQFMLYTVILLAIVLAIVLAMVWVFRKSRKRTVGRSRVSGGAGSVSGLPSKKFRVLL